MSDNSRGATAASPRGASLSPPPLQLSPEVSRAVEIAANRAVAVERHIHQLEIMLARLQEDERDILARLGEAGVDEVKPQPPTDA